MHYFSLEEKSIQIYIIYIYSKSVHTARKFSTKCFLHKLLKFTKVYPALLLLRGSQVDNYHHLAINYMDICVEMLKGVINNFFTLLFIYKHIFARKQISSLKIVFLFYSNSNSTKKLNNSFLLLNISMTHLRHC